MTDQLESTRTAGAPMWAAGSRRARRRALRTAASVAASAGLLALPVSAGIAMAAPTTATPTPVVTADADTPITPQPAPGQGGEVTDGGAGSATQPKPTWLYDCDGKPTALLQNITVTCDENPVTIKKIDWYAWTDQLAVGTGVSAVDGGLAGQVSLPVLVILSGVTSGEANGHDWDPHFTTARVVGVEGLKEYPLGSAIDAAAAKVPAETKPSTSAPSPSEVKVPAEGTAAPTTSATPAPAAGE